MLLFFTLLLTSCGKPLENMEEKNNTQEIISEEKTITVGDSDSDIDTVNLDETVIALMKTNFWDIKLEIYLGKVPMTATNFLVHAQNNYYDGITFHRIINGFMIQWGDPEGTGMGWESIYWETFDDEFDPSLSNVPGTISMANRGPNTNGSQFFINQWNNTNLDYNKQPLSSKHAVFWKVIEWMDVVEKIALVPSNPATGKPNDEVIIEDIQLYTLQDGNEVEYIIEDTQQAKEQAIENNKKISESKQEALQTKVAESGDTVGVKYRLTLNDGTQIDGNFDTDATFDFTIDQQGIITGFSDAVKWMKIGDTKTVQLQPEDAYWQYDESLTQSVEKSQLQTFVDAGIKLEKWNVLPTERWNFPIVDVTETEVIIDINHPLAGKELNFELELKYFVN